MNDRVEEIRQKLQRYRDGRTGVVGPARHDALITIDASDVYYMLWVIDILREEVKGLSK